MKPFLILQLRPEDPAADNEFQAFLRAGRLSADQAHRVRMEQAGLPSLELDDYSGVIVGGGPSNVSDAPESKSAEQKRFEPQLQQLLDRIVERDFPYLGACYGLGALASHQGAVVSKERYSEPVGPITVYLTEEGQADPLLAGLPEEFRAFVGHKEACQQPPAGAVLLARSATCPQQGIRVKQNIYAFQFHPELDIEGICLRIDIYRHAGYFPPEEAEPLKRRCQAEREVPVPVEIMRRFVERYRRD